MPLSRCRIGVVPQIHFHDTPSESNARITDLPDEIMLKIFSSLSYYEIVRNVRPVCKRWRNISNDEKLFTDLKFGTGFGGLRSFNARLVITLIRQASQLRSFEYFSNNNLKRILIALSENCPGLRVLELSCQPLTYNAINALVMGCPLITSLSLFDIRGRPRNGYIPFTNLRHLRVLKIERCPCIDDEFIHVLTNNHPQLTTLHLISLTVSEASIASLLQQLRPTLRNLNLSDVRSAAFYAIFNCKRLEKCVLSSCSNNLLCTLSLLATLPNLKSIRLNRFTSPVCNPKYSYNAWPCFQFRCLTEAIFFSCEGLNDEVIHRLAMTAPLLSILCIDNCRNVTDVGVMLATVHCRNLTHLYLARIDLGTLKFLLHIEIFLPSLKVLAIFFCRFASRMLSDYMIRRPNNVTVLTEANERFWNVATLALSYPSSHFQRLYIDCEMLDENKYPDRPKPSSCIVRKDF